MTIYNNICQSHPVIYMLLCNLRLYAQMSIAPISGQAGINKQDESGGFVVLSSPPPMPPPAAMVASSSSSSLPVPASSAAICIDYAIASRVISAMSDQTMVACLSGTK